MNSTISTTTTATPATSDFKAQWNEAMNWWKSQDQFTQTGIRNLAEKRMINRGCQEIGSSDMNHEVFAMYQEFISYSEFKKVNVTIWGFLIDSMHNLM